MDIFKKNNPNQYDNVIKPLYNKLIGNTKFNDKETIIIQGKTQSGKTDITFLFASQMTQLDYNVFIVTKKSCILRDQFIERSKSCPYFINSSIILKEYSKNSKINTNSSTKIKIVYIYLYGEDYGLMQLSKFICDKSIEKSCIIFDEFHIATSNLTNYIEHNGIYEDIKLTQDMIHIINHNKLCNSVIFGISATPFHYRDTRQILKAIDSIYFLNPEPKGNQRYIDILDITRHEYSKVNYFNEPISYESYYKIYESKEYGNRKIMKVILYYDIRFNDRHNENKQIIESLYPNMLVETLNQKNKVSIIDIYRTALMSNTEGIVFIGHDCLSEGISFRPYELIELNKIKSDYIIFGPTDMIINPDVKLEYNLETIIQVIGRCTGYININSKYKFEVRLWFSEAHNSYFKPDGHLDTFFKMYNNKHYTNENEVVLNIPSLSIDKSDDKSDGIDKTLICPPPTRAYKINLKKLDIEVRKLNNVNITSLNNLNYIDLKCQSIYTDKKFKLKINNNFNVNINDKVNDYFNSKKQSDYHDNLYLACNKYYDPSISKKILDRKIYTYYSSNDNKIINLVLSEDKLCDKHKTCEITKLNKKYCEINNGDECNICHGYRDRPYVNTEFIVMPHPKYMNSNGTFNESTFNTITWDKCIIFTCEKHIDETNSKGYLIIDDHILLFSFKGELVRKHTIHNFYVSNESINILNNFISSITSYVKLSYKTFIQEIKKYSENKDDFNKIIYDDFKIHKMNCKCLFHKYCKQKDSLDNNIKNCINELKIKYPILKFKSKLAKSKLDLSKLDIKIKSKSSNIKPKQISLTINKPNKLKETIKINLSKKVNQPINNEKKKQRIAEIQKELQRADKLRKELEELTN
jgi:hypothetical protein